MDFYRIKEYQFCMDNAERIQKQDGLTPLLAQKVDKWNESQFKIWCDYHYSVCREQSVLGASNHVVIIGEK